MKLSKKETIIILALALVGAITLLSLTAKGANYLYHRADSYYNYMNQR